MKSEHSVEVSAPVLPYAPFRRWFMRAVATGVCCALFALLIAACRGDADRPDAAEGGTDGGIDASLDSGLDGGDAGRDGGRWTGPGCNPSNGVECDGDWTTRCRCSADQCCSPQRGRFACVDRGEDGSCPAADLWVDTSRIENLTSVEWQFFEANDCAIAEGCVTAPGWRRLLRFDTWTPNTGTADLFLGTPRESAEHFEYSPCHDHYHFNGYANYELRSTDGTIAAVGHKQAFCLLDFYRYPGEEDRGASYSCAYQGIQRGWQDVYDAELDCQWVDVTDVAPGTYELGIALNVDHVLLESNYDNNEARVQVTIPADEATDVTAPCAAPRAGSGRACGLTREGEYTCTPGATVTVGCSSGCGLGSCRGDTILRACEVSAGTRCDTRRALANNDDGGCREGDTCSQLTFTCPASGAYAVFWGAYDLRDAAQTSCTVAVR